MAFHLNKDTVYRAAKPRDKECFINEGEGFIWSSEKTAPKYGSSSSPSKGSEKLLFGVHPDTTLENVRRKAEEARNNFADGIDPSEIRKQSRAEIAQVAENQPGSKPACLSPTASITSPDSGSNRRRIPCAILLTKRKSAASISTCFRKLAKSRSGKLNRPKSLP
ncbi:integrase arm-type DNA-binding domain-containing protein [Methylomonas koyamae]|uniref:integrase arm-type DNA-binding domain-containing protein n=1 Tax=Methylomonas koyamae TaxID=702114 RepID=UPI0021B3978E|nr:integrase arm-type DNA-binding domain-containing protein [Methylomonas koyamae]